MDGICHSVDWHKLHMEVKKEMSRDDLVALNMTFHVFFNEIIFISLYDQRKIFMYLAEVWLKTGGDSLNIAYLLWSDQSRSCAISDKPTSPAVAEGL